MQCIKIQRSDQHFSPHTSQSNICRFGNSSLSSFIGDTVLDFTLSELLIIFWKILICASFPLVYLHTSFRFETVSTNVTLESVFSLLWQSHGPTPGSTPPSVDTSTGTGFCLFFQEGLLVPGISPEGRGSCLLIGMVLPGMSKARPLSFA